MSPIPAEPLSGRRILLGITGSIAAYKGADLVRRVRELGAEVRVVMTQAATQFITPLTLQALSGHPVRMGLLDAEAEAGMDHIALARWAEAVLVAPASADFIARAVQGLADDLLATLCLATEASLAMAPAMNHQMWQHPATQANCEVLRRRGVHLWGPAEGEQACGEQGPGRMLEPQELVEHLRRLFTPKSLTDIRVLVSAGPTREALDPVRFISNRSSGKMGFAVAQAAAEAGAEVTLVSGPVALPTPLGVRRRNGVSAQEMLQAVLAEAPHHDIFIAVAAVADYRPVERFTHKLKKGLDRLELVLERTPDIVSSVTAFVSAPFTVGFAAETGDLEVNARAKLRAKGLDMIAANRVGETAEGFEGEENALTVFWQGGEVVLSRARKLYLARQLMAIVAERFHAKNNSGQIGYCPQGHGY
jgi:phosphopantothenoylcysteine decarboxylase/phosphopantothenate--cysteine ligase